MTVFDDLDARPWAERARRRAPGRGSRPRHCNLPHLSSPPKSFRSHELVAQGLSNREVAAQLFVSRRTVDFHLRNVYTKLGVTSRRTLTQEPPAAAAEHLEPRRFHRRFAARTPRASRGADSAEEPEPTAGRSSLAAGIRLTPRM